MVSNKNIFNINITILSALLNINISSLMMYLTYFINGYIEC